MISILCSIAEKQVVSRTFVFSHQSNLLQINHVGKQDILFNQVVYC